MPGTLFLMYYAWNAVQYYAWYTVPNVLYLVLSVEEGEDTAEQDEDKEDKDTLKADDGEVSTVEATPEPSNLLSH